MVEGLQALRARGLRLACLTNKPNAFARPLLALKGLDGYFDHAFGGDAFARKKPDPLPLVETCKALGSDPARTLMVGDSRNDAEAARAAGCPVVLVSYGYNHGEPAASAHPDAVIDRLDQLAARLGPGRAAVALNGDRRRPAPRAAAGRHRRRTAARLPAPCARSTSLPHTPRQVPATGEPGPGAARRACTPDLKRSGSIGRPGARRRR